MKPFYLMSICLILLTGCQFISPIVTNYNGVRMDVAHYINHSWRFSLKERDVLVDYAKAQQQLSAWPRLTQQQQHTLARDLFIQRSCSAKKVSPHKLDLVDAQIFADRAGQQKLAAMYAMQQQLGVTQQAIDCNNKI